LRSYDGSRISQFPEIKTRKTRKNNKNDRRASKILFVAMTASLVFLMINFFDGDILEKAFGRSVSAREIILKISRFDGVLKQEYFTHIIGSETIARSVIKYTGAKNIDPSLLVALMKVESKFNPRAENYNYNGSVDRGLCQLNDLTFTGLKREDFFDPETNIKNAATYLDWCLKKSGNKLVRALAYYNIGIGNVAKRKVGPNTLDYIGLIIEEKRVLDAGLKTYLSEHSDLLF
jgi:membrane-bound lytic murein transglycosylase MltF